MVYMTPTTSSTIDDLYLTADEALACHTYPARFTVETDTGATAEIVAPNVARFRNTGCLVAFRVTGREIRGKHRIAFYGFDQVNGFDLQIRDEKIVGGIAYGDALRKARAAF